MLFVNGMAGGGGGMEKEEREPQTLQVPKALWFTLS